MKIPKYILYSFVISLIVFGFTIALNSTAFIILKNSVKLSSVIDYPLSGFIEEIIRVSITIVILKKVISKEQKIHILNWVIIFVPIVFTFFEKGQSLSAALLDFLNKPSYLSSLVITSVFLHFWVHYYLFKISLFSWISKNWIALVSISIVHGLINLVMVLNPINYHLTTTLSKNIFIKMGIILILLFIYYGVMRPLFKSLNVVNLN